MFVLEPKLLDPLFFEEVRIEIIPTPGYPRMLTRYLTILTATMALVPITRPDWHNRPIEVFEIADCVFTEKRFGHGLLAPFWRSPRPY
jgi:hypothetical protein